MSLLAKKLLSSGLNLEFRSSATSQTPTITGPADIQAGDLLVLYDRALNNSGTPTLVVPSGFETILDETTLTTRRTVCSMKIATGAEANASLTGMDATNTDNKILLVFSTGGAVDATAFDAAYEATDSTPTSQTINASTEAPPLVVFAFVRQQTLSGNTMSPTEDGTVTVGTNRAWYKIYNSSPADVTMSTSDQGTNNTLMSFGIRLS